MFSFDDCMAFERPDVRNHYCPANIIFQASVVFNWTVVNLNNFTTKNKSRRMSAFAGKKLLLMKLLNLKL